MIQNEKIGYSKEKPLIIFSALDWGLGHTTRSIPFIQELIDQGCEIIIACNSIQKNVYQAEFPQIKFEFLKGYGIRYGANRLQTRLKLLLILPDILIRINKERVWLNNFLSKNTVAAIVSDNRYGFSAPGIPAILITHQLSAYTGSGKFFDSIVQSVIYKWISRFTECWVPDFELEPSLSGELGHPKNLPSVPVKYTGPVSRLKPQPSVHFIYDAVIILSGPEPQRTILENLIVADAVETDFKLILIRGMPGSDSSPKFKNIRAVNHADSTLLNTLINQAAVVISRSGYTSIMDLVKLQKKMVLIPTPGQPEQEYLAAYLSSEKLAITFSQQGFSLKLALKEASAYPYKILNHDMNEYKSVVQRFVSAL